MTTPEQRQFLDAALAFVIEKGKLPHTVLAAHLATLAMARATGDVGLELIEIYKLAQKATAPLRGSIQQKGDER